MYAAVYEIILRRVFECERGGDPAGLAEAGNYRDAYIESIKVGLLYACEFVTHKGNDSQQAQIRSVVQTLEAANSTDDVNPILQTLVDLVNQCRDNV